MINRSDILSDFTLTESIQWDFTWPRLEEDRNLIFSYVENRFGIRRELFDPFFLFKRTDSWWLLKKNRFISSVSKLKVNMVGFRAFHKVGDYIKPTTRFAQIWGRYAIRSKINLNRGQLKELISKDKIPFNFKGLENGYVIVFYEDVPIGVGLFLSNTLYCQLPKKEFQNIID